MGLGLFWTRTGPSSARVKLYPCRYEDQLKAEGKCQDDIRPPRYKESGIPDYPAGSKTVVCELCPMKRGVFKQTVEDGSGEKKWAHVVCALWQTPDVTVASANKPDVVRIPMHSSLLSHNTPSPCNKFTEDFFQSHTSYRLPVLKLSP